MKIKLIGFLLLLTINLTTGFAQDFNGNLQKYWHYRELLKNFVVAGDGIGCSNISNSLSGGKNLGTLNYNDQTHVLGDYLGVLAMEHYLLRTNSQSLNENTEELFYAIEAINTLDKKAETYWCQTQFNLYGSTGSNYNLTGYVPNINNDLNGFFIRDETPYNLLDIDYNGMSIENHLGDHWAPFEDGVRKMRVDGSFTDRQYKKYSSNPEFDKTDAGPVEMSMDQVIELTGGLILTAKFVDPSLTYPGHQFADGETNFLQEIKNIVHRIGMWCKGQNNAWVIKDPVTGQCVKALDWYHNSCQDGGAAFYLLCHAYAIANARIEDNFTYPGPYWNTYYQGKTLNGPLWVTNGYFYNSPPPHPFEDTKVLMLAAMSDVWGSQTLSKLTDRSTKDYDDVTINFPHYPLLNCVLYSKTSLIPNTVYECMLNTADPIGQRSSPFNYEWNDQRLLYGPNVQHRGYSDYRWGEFMYYFNMYCIYNPSYMNGQYHKIDPLQLCQMEIEKTGKGNNTAYAEWDWKKFAAVDQIKAGNLNNAGDYIIKNYDGQQAQGVGQGTMCDPKIVGNYIPQKYNLGPPYYYWDGNTGDASNVSGCTYDFFESQDPTKVTFVAGNQVAMLPGFEVHANAELDAYTHDNLAEYTGGMSETCVACSNCKISGSEHITSSDYNVKSTDRLYKVYSFVPGELLVVTPHVIFKVEAGSAVGLNMFGLNEIPDGGCPNEYAINLDGASYILKGYQRFRDPLVGSHGIIDVDYYKGYLFVSFADKRIFRIKGTGGTGQNMFGVTDDNSSLTFYKVAGAPNLDQATYKFQHKIFDVEVANNELLIAINREFAANDGNGTNSYVYKFNNIGTTGVVNGSLVPTNFWNINENNLATIYGSANFKGSISCMRYLNDNLFVATENNGNAKGKLLKVKNTGGSGQNMFNVSEYGNGSTFAFSGGNSGTQYYLGDEYFGGTSGSNSRSYVTEMFFYNDETYFALADGKICRLYGTGGTGHSMFNIAEYQHSFGTHDQYATNYIHSYEEYTGNGNNSYVYTMEQIQGFLLVGLVDGRLFKYDVLATHPQGSSTIAPLTGHSNFESSVVSITKFPFGCPGGEDPDDPRGAGHRETSSADDICYCYNDVYIGLAGTQIIGVRNSGGTGDNFYALSWQGDGNEKKEFVGRCGYQYFKGSQNFNIICAGARYAAADSSLRDYVPPLSHEEYLAMAEEIGLADQYQYSEFYDLSIWPNPGNGVVSIKFISRDNNNSKATITDIMGKTLKEIDISPNVEQKEDLGLSAGIYYICIKPSSIDYTITKKLIVQ